MCFYERTIWLCGYWKWGRFRERCPFENRIGETCGLKLVYDTKRCLAECDLCSRIGRKKRRVQKLTTDIDRWNRDKNLPATVERAEREERDLLAILSDLEGQHHIRVYHCC
ncbi:hypothetical protein EV126DRAFT_173202 [Verticillium dahliae]|nr:hypothetical protein EV126DRAFT_173202 [Verticillium dahliae]